MTNISLPRLSVAWNRCWRSDSLLTPPVTRASCVCRLALRTLKTSKPTLSRLCSRLFNAPEGGRSLYRRLFCNPLCLRGRLCAPLEVYRGAANCPPPRKWRRSCLGRPCPIAYRAPHKQLPRNSSTWTSSYPKCHRSAYGFSAIVAFDACVALQQDEPKNDGAKTCFNVVDGVSASGHDVRPDDRRPQVCVLLLTQP